MIRFIGAWVLCLCAGMAVAAQPGKQTLTAAERPTPAPDFTLPDMDGKPHALAEYRGKVVVLNFWATWCPPCRYEMPSMQRAWEKVRNDGIVFVAVNVGENADTVFTFLADYPVDFPLLFDLDGQMIKRYPVTGLPTTYIIDPQGRISHRAVGGREWDDPVLLQALRALREPPP